MPLMESLILEVTHQVQQPNVILVPVTYLPVIHSNISFIPNRHTNILTAQNLTYALDIVPSINMLLT